MTRMAITGHRPGRLGDEAWVAARLGALLTDLHVTLMYQGMADGADLLAADVAAAVEVPYVAVRPWATHAGQDAQHYMAALAGAVEVVVLNPVKRYTGPDLYHARNRYMVDHADVVCAIWDGQAGGGTAATVAYAKRLGKPVYVINPVLQQVSTPLW